MRLVRRLLLLALAAAVVAPVARAAGPQPSFGLRAAGNPKAGYFIFPAGAGTTQHGVVIVSNTGKGAGTVELTVADASTGSTTGTIYLTAAKPKGSATWVKLGKTEVTLAPQRAVRIPFTVAVPAGAAAGQYVAGIVAADKNQPTAGKSSGKTSVQIKIRNLAIMAVQVNVPGPTIHRFTIGAVKAGGSRGFQQILFGIANKGNVLEHPSGSVSIFDAAGKRVETIPYRMDTFLPHTEIDYPVTLKKALPAGAYTASVNVSYGGKTTTAKPAFQVSKENLQHVFTSSSPTQAPPSTAKAGGSSAGGSSSGGRSKTWLWIVLAAAVVVLLAVAFLLLRRRRPPTPAPAASAPAPAPACDPYHHWIADYDAGVTVDGVTRYPHRCRDCGLQVVAKDVPEATEFAAAMRRS